MADETKTPRKKATGKKTATPKLNVWQRINKVRGELKKVDKDKTVGKGDSAYLVTTHEAIKAILRPLMADAGLVDYIEELEYVRAETGVVRGKYDDSKRKLISHQGKYMYHVVNIDDPKDTHSFPVRGDGEDTGDKGPGKATTYALKSGQKILFQIGTKGDEEEDRSNEEDISQEPVEMVSDKQIDHLMELADELFGDVKKGNEMLALMAGKYQIDDVSKMPASWFDKACSDLKKKAASEKKIADAAAKVAEKDEPEAEPEGPQPPDDELPLGEPPTDDGSVPPAEEESL